MLRNFIIFVFIFFISIFLLQDGIKDYKSFLDEVRFFNNAENEKVKQYVVYTQYGGFGIKLIYVPSAFGVMNNYDNVGIVGSVNTAERLSISKPIKGKGFFSEQSPYSTFAGILIIAGVIIAIYLGYSLSIKTDYLKIIKLQGKSITLTLFSRLIIINLLFILIVSGSFLLALINGINLFGIQAIYFIFVGILVLSFFLCLGAFIGTLAKPISSLIFMGVLLFIFIIVTPLVTEKWSKHNVSDLEPTSSIELKNVKLYAEVEKKLIETFGLMKPGDKAKKGVAEKIKNMYGKVLQQFREKEKNLKDKMSDRIKENQIISSFFPLNFYLTTVKEISGLGSRGYIKFYSFCQHKKKEFFKFFFKEKYILESEEGKGKIKIFQNGDGNIFYATPQLPHGFTLGIIMTLLYTLGLLGWTYHRLSSRLNPGLGNDPNILIEKGKTCFIYCTDETVKHDMLDHYRQDQTSVVIEKIDPGHFPNLSTDKLVHHFSSLTGQGKKITDYLATMGVRSLDIPSNPEVIKKIYVAVQCSSDRDTIILDDFLKGETREFETGVKDLFLQLESQDKRILYLSTGLFDVTGSPLDIVKIDRFKLLPLTQLHDIILR